MANLEKVIKVTEAQYETLEQGGTVGDYTGINPNYLYLTEYSGDGPATYLKSASTSGNTLTLTKQDDTTVTYTPSFTDNDHYPTTFAWTNGTTAGPTGSLTGNSGFTAVSFGAIPAAGFSQSGIMTTGAQSFAGTKTFNGTQDDVPIQSAFDNTNTYFFKVLETQSQGEIGFDFTETPPSESLSIHFKPQSDTVAYISDLPQILDLR